MAREFAERVALEELPEHVADLAAERLARLFELFEQTAVGLARTAS